MKILVKNKNVTFVYFLVRVDSWSPELLDFWSPGLGSLLKNRVYHKLNTI